MFFIQVADTRGYRPLRRRRFSNGQSESHCRAGGGGGGGGAAAGAVAA